MKRNSWVLLLEPLEALAHDFQKLVRTPLGLVDRMRDLGLAQERLLHRKMDLAFDLAGDALELRVLVSVGLLQVARHVWRQGAPQDALAPSSQ